eukprot:Platyproteum_vivax@DN4680_c0_g1_i1.p1
MYRKKDRGKNPPGTPFQPRETPTQSKKRKAAEGKIKEAELAAIQAKKAKIVEEVATLFPFTTHIDDHCETPLVAYKDLHPLLVSIGACNQQAAADSIIYDPYYCDGQAVLNLNTLGFANVINENVDFYQRMKEDSIPEHDILVTNPPYSVEHVKRFLQYVAKSSRPWAALMPVHIVQKPYTQKILGSQFEKLLYIVPKKRYAFWTPKHLARKKHTHTGPLGERTSPFVSMWFVGNLEEKSLEVVNGWLSQCTNEPKYNELEQGMWSSSLSAAFMCHGSDNLPSPIKEILKNDAKMMKAA